MPRVHLPTGSIQKTATFLRRLRYSWKVDQGSRMAAALAYYTFLALAPVLIISASLVGILFGKEAARGEMVMATKEAIGHRGAEALQAILQKTWQSNEGLVALGVSLCAMLLGAYWAFHELKEGLFRILASPADKKAGRHGILKRLMSIGWILLVGLGLVVLMIGGLALDAARRYLGLSPGFHLTWILDYLFTLGVGAIFLALLYRFVPGGRAKWKEVWIGAGISAGLFALGRFLVSLYLKRMTSVPASGSAGFFVVILIWFYYSARVVYFGAEVTRLCAIPEAATEGCNLSVPPDVDTSQVRAT